jgi:hypothetical protein
MFLLTASLSNIGNHLIMTTDIMTHKCIAKNIAWLALSGTRARMHSSFCRKDNLGDVTAKSGSQSTAAGLLGTGFGVALAAVCGTSPQVALTAYLPLVALSLYGVYRSNCVVIINSFDRQRIDLLIYHYLQTGQGAPTCWTVVV